MAWFVFLSIVLPAILLFLKRSDWLLDYYIWVTALNRGIRRVVDWWDQAFNPLSPISLSPLIVGCLMATMVFLSPTRVPQRVVRILMLFGSAIAIAFCVGLARNQFAAVYSLAEYAGPLATMGMAVVYGRSTAVFDRWIKTLGWAAVAVSIYAWYQYFTIPPWDAFWVESIGAVGYLGQLRPTEMTVFSTMQERGPCAFFLAWAVIPMILARRWRNPFGWAAVFLIVGTVLVTYVRSGLITIALAAIAFPLVNRGRGVLRIVMLAIALYFSVNALLPKIGSGADSIENRLNTFRDITADGSYQGRLDIAQWGFSMALREPLGTGLGSTGLGSRVNTGSFASQAVFGDNGYFDLILTFGWLGSIAFGCALYLAWRQIRNLERIGFRNDISMAAKTAFIVGGITLYGWNWVNGSASLLFWMLIGRALSPVVTPAQLAVLARAGAGTRSAPEPLPEGSNPAKQTRILKASDA